MTHFYLRVAIFCLGLIIGLYLGCKSATNKAIKSSIDSHMIKHIPSYDNWSLKRGIQRKVLPWDALRYSNITFILEADVLFKEINVLCLIIVRNNKNVQAAENTWARGCNNIHYVETVSTDKKKLPGMRTKEHSSWILLCKAVEGDKMYTYHYLLYKLQIFTQGTLGNLPYESDVPDEHIWRTFLKERNIHDENITADQYYKVWTNLINDPTSFAAHMKKEIHSVDYS
ncbi:unnamed protein product [Acanthoscelides obtectus]|uniref:Uncharacterized protein n=1 Tax=Acanthoscelides obtectus TaxID=200917 RepID=A0A9P0PTL9_ACAOB|nr:unnamed protein product [Acanthoscelides obtectus]CAK1668249.1 hypothetical protein AOBTE_LOCUS26301 [Acanthoscelides obtectus]